MTLSNDLRQRAHRAIALADTDASIDEILEMLRVVEELQLIYDPDEWQAGRLHPPASPEALVRLAAAVPTVPRALAALYRWHDGRDDVRAEMWGFDALGTGRFLPIDEAIEHIRSIQSVRADYSSTHFPYLAFNGGVDVHVVETAPSPHLGWRGYWDHELTGPAELEEPLLAAIRLAVEMSISSLEQDE